MRGVDSPESVGTTVAESGISRSAIPQAGTGRKAAREAIGQLLRHLEEVILNGVYKPGDMLGTEVDLARQTGLSREAIRRAVDRLRERGLVERRAGKGLYVCRRGVRAHQVQVVLPDLASEQNARMLRGVQDVALEQGVVVQAYDAHASMDKDIQLLRSLPDTGMDGAVIWALPHPHFALAIYELQSRGYPFVLVDQPLRDLRVAAVTADNYGGGRAAGEALIGLGHRRIAFIGNLEAQTCQARMEGLRDAIAAAGLPFDLSLVKKLAVGDSLLGDWSPAIDQAVQELMEHELPPTAVLCSCDQVACRVCQAVKARGLRVPQDLSVVGFDDISLCEMLDPPLASVAQPLEEMGRVAMQMLLEQIAGEKTSDCRVLPTRWVPRASVQAIASA